MESIFPQTVTRSLKIADDVLSFWKVGIVGFDADLKCQFWSSYLSMPENIPADPIGQPLFKLLPFFDQPTSRKQIQNVLDGKTAQSEDHIISATEGEQVRILQISAATLRSEQDIILGGVLIIHDISEIRKTEQILKETELRFKNMADSSPVLLWMSGVDGLCNFFNQTWLDFTGRTLAEEWGVGWAENVHHEDFQMCMDTYTRSFNKREPFEIEYRLLRRDGQYRWILDRGTPRYSPDGSFVGYIGSCVDINDRKTAENSLMAAKIQADTANQAKSNFLAIMSHEIRTPLGAIIGFSELIAGGELSLQDRDQYIQSVRRNGTLLSNIINSILDLSKIESGKFEVQKNDVVLTEVLDEIMALMSLQATEKGILLERQLDANLPKWISTDSVRLKQILINLLGNAIKFTDKGEIRLHVMLEPEFRDKNLLSFIVSDTGRGMTKEEKQIIFEPFSQGDTSSTRRYGGVGLGLTLAKSLAKALGGDITLISSESGSGSHFRLTIDKGHAVGKIKETIGPVQPPLGQKPSLENLHILVVDDVKDNRILIERYLSNRGIKNLDFAENGAEAVRKALQHPYDCILMDLQMPVMDGIEATKTLRKSGYHKPIWALTAYALREERDRCLAEGFDDHFSKPVDRKRLLQHLEDLSHETPSLSL
jgi:PAS domain S-box-containing protein